LKNWVEGNALNFVIVGVLEETLTSVGPDDYAVVSSTSGKLLSILLISDTVDCISMSADLLDHLTRVGIINENTISHCYQNLGSI
jgi:hypothetical protein